MRRKQDDLEGRLSRLAERAGADVSLTYDRDDGKFPGRKAWSINLAWNRGSNNGPPNYWQEYREGRTLVEALVEAEALVESALVQLTAERAGLGHD